jgi:hypothetical protein
VAAGGATPAPSRRRAALRVVFGDSEHRPCRRRPGTAVVSGRARTALYAAIKYSVGREPMLLNTGAESSLIERTGSEFPNKLEFTAIKKNLFLMLVLLCECDATT